MCEGSNFSTSSPPDPSCIDIITEKKKKNIIIAYLGKYQHIHFLGTYNVLGKCYMHGI